MAITTIITLLAVVLTLPGCAATTTVDGLLPANEIAAIGEIVSVTVVMQLTGEKSPNRTDRFLLHGTDLGSIPSTPSTAAESSIS
jgi:hypothetical protein